MKIGLLTVSDTCHRDPKLDKSGPVLKECFNEHFKDSTYVTGIVPDEEKEIKEWLTGHSSELDVIVTTGGTGLSSRLSQRSCDLISFLEMLLQKPHELSSNVYVLELSSLF